MCSMNDIEHSTMDQIKYDTFQRLDEQTKTRIMRNKYNISDADKVNFMDKVC